MVAQSANGFGSIRFWISIGGYFVGLIFLMEWAFVLAPIPVAVYWAYGKQQYAKSFIAVAVLAGIQATILVSFGTGFAIVAFALMGIYLGNGFRFGQTYNAQVVIVILVASVFIGVLVGLRWNRLDTFIEDLGQDIEEIIADPESELSSRVEQNLNMQLWVVDQWQYVLPGTMLGGVVMFSCMSVSLMARGIRNGGMPVNGSFLIFRPPDLLVWTAIVTGVLWYVNYQNPSPGVQIVSWNAAVALTVVYSLNGLSVITYGVALMKPHPVLLLILAGLMFLTGLQLLAVLGLFDTWGDFRKKIDVRLKELRALSDEDR
jgi:hypothetical protein